VNPGLSVGRYAASDTHVTWEVYGNSGLGVRKPRNAHVGSDQGAVSAFRLARFPGPPAEPDMPVSEHPALHKIVSLDYAAVPSVWLGHGEGMVLPR
jgi:hypothetical protein